MPLIQECTEDVKESSECAQGAPGTAHVVTKTELGPGQQLVHDYEPGDEEIIPVHAIKQESFKGVQESRQVVHYNKPSLSTMSLQPSGLQYFWRRVSCTGEELVKKYRRSRKLLGNSVEDAHVAWRNLMACDSIHPVIKASTMSFGVVSTPETVALLHQHWHGLWQRMDHGSSDYEVSRFMVQYALAWAIMFQDLKKALAKVKACYNDMKKLNPDNFFLAPFYTVTIGRWIYEVNEDNLSCSLMRQVLWYAEETLRLIGTLEDDWAIADTFAAKISALKLLMLVEDYFVRYYRYTEFCTNLYMKIESLYAEIKQHLLQRSSEILLYDRAWFHSINASYCLRASKAAITQDQREQMYAFYQCSLHQSACMYDRNGRWWRAREEADRTGDPLIIYEFSKKCHCAPSV